MKTIPQKIVMAVLAAALAMAAVPVGGVFALIEDPPAPTNERLEKAWARQVKTYERLGRAYENGDERLAKLQGMIDKAAENGKDVSDLQAALDAYKAALTAARPAYEALGEIISAHAGFDANGRIADAEQAKVTVKEARDQMKAIKESMGGAFKALRAAIKAFRAANKPAERDSVGH